MGDLKSYYENEELSLVLKGTTLKGKNIRVKLPLNLTEMFMTEGEPMQVDIINPVTGKTFSFYKEFHKVEQLDIDIPTKIMENFQANKEVIVKMKQLLIWDFVNQMEGKTSDVIKFNKDGVLVANLGGKEIPIESFDYGYTHGHGIGGIGGDAYVEFQINDISGTTSRPDGTWRYPLCSVGRLSPTLGSAVRRS